MNMNRHVLTDQGSPWNEPAPGVRRKLIHTDHLMMVIVEFTGGPAEYPDPFHDHPHEQVSYIAEGELNLFVRGAGEKKLQRGDMFAIPSGIPHTIQTLSPLVRIIDCFTPLRQDFIQ
jgi:quercetin dioxygenase-like cupin family protein